MLYVKKNVSASLAVSSPSFRRRKPEFESRKRTLEFLEKKTRNRWTMDDIHTQNDMPYLRNVILLPDRFETHIKAHLGAKAQTQRACAR